MNKPLKCVLSVYTNSETAVTRYFPQSLIPPLPKINAIYQCG